MCNFHFRQTVHVGSPVLDLLYYLFWSVDPKARRTYWHEMLSEYYEAFKAYSESVGATLKFTFEVARLFASHLISTLFVYSQYIPCVIGQKLWVSYNYSRKCCSFQDLLRDYKSKLELGFFIGMFQIFGMEGMEEMTEVDQVEVDMAEYFTSTMVTTVEKKLATKGNQYCQSIIDSYNEYLDVKYGQQ